MSSPLGPVVRVSQDVKGRILVADPLRSQVTIVWLVCAMNSQ